MRLTAHTTALLAFLAFFLILVIDVRHWSWRDPSSVFFDPEHAFEREYSLHREAQAESFVRSAAWASPNATYHKSGPNPSFCVGMTTVQREGARYFRTALGSVVAELSQWERTNLWVVPFIVNPNPREHLAYNETWLPRLSDQVLTYDGAKDEVREKVKDLTKPGADLKRKAVFDYIYLLRTCYEKGTEWVVMLEDDTIAAQGWFRRTRRGLEELVKKKDGENTLYLRLFYNERLLGWNSEEWVSYAIRSLIVEAVLLITLVIVARYVPSAAGALTPLTIATITLVLAPMCITLFFLAGRLTVAGPTHNTINLMNQYGCCSQAFVFPRAQIPSLLAWYEKAQDGYLDPVTHVDKTQIDSLTEIYADKEGLSRYALTPSVFQHVGAQSTKQTTITRWGRSNTENIWNFSFEKFPPSGLTSNHFW